MVLISNGALICYEYLGKYLRTNANTEKDELTDIGEFETWGEEEEKLPTSQRSGCQKFSLALDVERRRLGLKFSETKVELL